MAENSKATLIIILLQASTTLLVAFVTITIMAVHTDIKELRRSVVGHIGDYSVHNEGVD